MLFFALACSKKDVDDQYCIYTSFDYELNDILTSTQRFKISTSNVGNQVILEYCIKETCEKYLLNSTNKAGNKYISFEGDTLNLLLEEKADYLINGVSHPVYKYLLNPEVIDGATQHFWSPEFGMLLTKSSTWKSFSHLTKTSQGNTEVLNQLLMILLNDRNMILKEKSNGSDFIIDDDLVEAIEEELKAYK